MWVLHHGSDDRRVTHDTNASSAGVHWSERASLVSGNTTGFWANGEVGARRESRKPNENKFAGDSRAHSRAHAMTTAKEVLEVYGKARDAAADAEGNTASEDRAVDALKLLAGMDIPLKVFSDGSLGDCPKAIRKMAKKGATDGIRAAADACVEAWKKIISSASAEVKTEEVKTEETVKTEEVKKEDETKTKGAKESDAHDGGEKTLATLLQPAETGDSLRDRTRTIFAEALALAVGQSGVYASLGDCAQAAIAVEEAMYDRWTDCGKDYKGKVRQLSFNLKDQKNPDLRRSVADGLIAPKVLLDLKPEELGSDERRSENTAIREAATAEAVRGQKKEASTDAFKCGKCKQRQCTYYQLQTRSADEPMTTFVTCVNCDNRWKFC